MVYLSQKPNTENGQFRVSVLVLVWEPHIVDDRRETRQEASIDVLANKRVRFAYTSKCEILTPRILVPIIKRNDDTLGVCQVGGGSHEAAVHAVSRHVEGWLELTGIHTTGRFVTKLSHLFSGS